MENAPKATSTDPSPQRQVASVGLQADAARQAQHRAGDVNANDPPAETCRDGGECPAAGADVHDHLVGTNPHPRHQRSA